MKRFPPICKGCADREVGCHQRCAKYLDTKREYERERDEERDRRYAEREIDELEMSVKRHIKERTRKHG